MQPFAAGIETGRYWLTRLHSSADTAGQRAFRAWLLAGLEEEDVLASSGENRRTTPYPGIS